MAETEFLRLIAVLIAPATFDLQGDERALRARVGRIERLLANDCAPLDHGDVWLEGCRSTAE
ncbi:hypothetical protein CLN94_11025 [Pseudothioclava arenosa]|uniref:Uncharacterized protein n=1 Tax=Pseudothioclava arenosa TaxID=1795308 RepID=A0A2A4CN66_9RHOB|nr:hypothetical protein CLN94_11025 [Pseudothioclava arenosa]